MAALVGLCLGTNAGAQVLPPSLLACSRVADDGERLRCFDRAIQSLSRPSEAKPLAPSVPPARSAVGDPPPAAPPAHAETFGHPAPPPPEAKRLEAHIASLSQSGPRPRFVLDNGQVWQQAETDDAFQAKVGDPVVLTKGMLGSYFMSAGMHAAVRVTRVK